MNTTYNSHFTLQHKDETKHVAAVTPEHQLPGYQKLFTVAEMWNLQRRSRTMLQRRKNA